MVYAIAYTETMLTSTKAEDPEKKFSLLRVCPRMKCKPISSIICGFNFPDGVTIKTTNIQVSPPTWPISTVSGHTAETIIS